MEIRPPTNREQINNAVFMAVAVLFSAAVFAYVAWYVLAALNVVPRVVEPIFGG